MSSEWTGLAADLLLALDRSSDEPLGAQLQCQLREAIRTGRLAPGDRLPSSRRLGQDLAVSRGLVVDAYAQLEAEGYLHTRGGSATRVATTPAPAVERRTGPPARPRPAIDFVYGEPDVERFPMRDWLWALGEAAKDPPQVSLANTEHHGLGPLRAELAAYLRRVRGAVVDPADVIVCNGFAQGVGIAARVLVEYGIDAIAVEDPRVVEGDAGVRAAGLRLVPVPVDDRGLDVARAAATAVRAAVVTPAHQAPTGVVLAPERRQALISLADERDGFVIEDDYDAEFRYDRQPVGAMQGLCPDRVIGIGSVSKSLAPGLRLGWIVAPPALSAEVARHKQIADRGSPGLDQLALAHLIRSGRYDRHLRRMRAVYAERRDALLDALAEHAPGVRLGGLAAGFHAVVHLPDGADERAIVAAAGERSVGLHGMSGRRSDGATDPPQLVIGFGNLTPAAIRQGIAAVADLLRC